MDNYQNDSSSGKKLLAVGALATAAGFLGAGKHLGNLIVKKKQADIAIKGVKAAIHEYQPKLNKLVKERNEVLNIPIWKQLRQGTKDVQILLAKNKMEGKFYEAAQHAASKETEFRNNLPSAVTNLDKFLVPAGLTAATLGVIKTAKFNFLPEEKLPYQATKESQDLKKVLIRPDLLREPTNYSRGMQCGPIIENADKMNKIASAINELFNKTTKQLAAKKDPKDKVIQKMDREIAIRDEALAQHELAHREKDDHIQSQNEKLKQLQKAIKQINGHAEGYRQKAIEHFTKSIDAEVAGNPGR